MQALFFLLRLSIASKARWEVLVGVLPIDFFFSFLLFCWCSGRVLIET